MIKVIAIAAVTYQVVKLAGGMDQEEAVKG
jgi:hypothetical protein